MRLLAEFSHPAQVHKFKHVLASLIRQGHEVMILSRDKDVMVPLLNSLGLPHECLSRARSGISGLALELIVRETRVFRRVLKYKPDLVLSAHSAPIVHAAWTLGIPRLVHEDTEFGTLQQTLIMPFASRILTTACYMKDWGPRQIRIDSVEPLCYLHPDHFRPRPDILLRYGVRRGEPFAVVRFVSWTAAHDIGIRADAVKVRERLIHSLLSAGAVKVFIASEGDRELPPDARVCRPEPEHFHDLLAEARICASEGITVANEAAVLGVPAVLANPLVAGHTSELERYGLVERVDSAEGFLDAVERVWNDNSAQGRSAAQRRKLLDDKVNMATALEDRILSFASAVGGRLRT